MSYILNIETSTTNCSVSLSHENNLIDCQEIDSPNYSWNKLIGQTIGAAYINICDKKGNACGMSRY